MIRLAMYPLVLQGMFGLGDGIYARPFVTAWSAHRAPESVTLWTPWPQLYTDVPNLRFGRPHLALRTQSKNLRRWHDWADVPPRAERKQFFYRMRDPRQTVLSEIEQRVGWPKGQSFRFDLPDFGPSPVPGRVAVVRPVTIRKEWANPARNPDPEYVAVAAAILRDAGYTVVLVADIDPKAEPHVGDLPDADASYIHGELPVEQLLALVQHAAVCVGGPGWIVPASIATRTPLICIAGGQGGHNGPETLIDKRMDGSRTRFILPDLYCRCNQKDHRCRKEISDFPDEFGAALAEVAA